MAKQLRIPSLQHLARNWHSDPQRICDEYVRLFANPPVFSYNCLFQAMFDLLRLGQPLAEVEQFIRNREKRKNYQEDFIAILRLIEKHFAKNRPDYVLQITNRFYSAGRDLKIPFKPPFICGYGEVEILPWPSFWKRNPLDQDRLSLFVTLVHEIMQQDPNLESALFKILDFSIPKGSDSRVLSEINVYGVPLLSEAEKREKLEIFAEGFSMAQQEVKKRQSEPSKDQPKDEGGATGQGDLFRGD